MTDEIEAVTESAKAVQEVAKTGRAVVEAGSGLARYLAKVFGTVPEDLVGLSFGDALRAKRLANAERVLAAAFERLEARGIEDPVEINTKHIQPLLEAVGEESDETLQAMWAELLANAMDPNKETHLQRVLIDTLRQLEPVDAIMLKVLDATQPKGQLTNATNIAKQVGLRSDIVVVSLERLHRIGCVYVNAHRPELLFESSLSINALGKELLLACHSEPNA